MNGVNKVTLIGFAGSDPEVKEMASGKKLTTFRMATSREYKDKNTGEKRSETQWHSLKAWGPIAETLAKWVRKGKHLYIEGEIQYSEYEAKDGSGKRYSTNIMVTDFSFLESKPKETGAEAGTEAAATKNVQDFKASPAQQGAPVAQTVSASSADVMGDTDDLPF